LHCTKRKGPCDQPYVREEEIGKQIRSLLKGVSLPPAAAAQALQNIEKEQLSAAQAGEEAAQNLRDKIDILNSELGQLLDMTLGGKLTQEEYAQSKAQRINEKKEIEMKLAAFARQGSNRFEPLIGFYKTAVLAGESAVSGKPEENLEIMKKIGSNFFLGGKRITFKLKSPWEKLQKYNSFCAQKLIKKQHFQIWGGFQDEVRTYFAQHPEETL